MNINVFTGPAPEFEPLAMVYFCTPCCGKRIRIPAQQLLSQVSDEVNKYYRQLNLSLEAENKRLRGIIETCGMITLIKNTATRL